jgi:pantothenate kinase
MIGAVPTPGLEELVDLAVGLVGERRRAVLGITGAPGAGKSTLVDALLGAVAERCGEDWVAHLPMDGFHLADVQLRRLGALDRKGAEHTFDGAGYAHTLGRVLSDPEEWIYVPGFERTLEQPLAAALVIPPSARLVVTEGNYLLLPSAPWTLARAQLAEVWFVTTEQDTRLERLIARHVEFGKAPAAAEEWVLTSDEANAEVVAATAGLADRVVVNGSAGWQLADA